MGSMRATVWRAFEVTVLLLGVASIVQAALSRNWQLFWIGGFLFLGAGTILWLRQSLQSSAMLWTISLERRYAPRSRRGEVAAALLKYMLGDDIETRRAFDSMIWPENRTRPRRPLLAPMTSVRRRRGWGTWAFSSRVTTDGLRITNAPRRGHDAQVIHVTLSQGNLGIYNNQGKRFLESSFSRELKESDALSKRARASLLDFKQLEPKNLGQGYPLRWASGGVLPIVDWRGEPWVALFFRDIRPIGWNVANGASESVADQISIGGLAQREFCEELLVCDGPPLSGVRVSTRPFAFPGPGGSSNVLTSRTFSAAHRRLRLEHDGVNLVEQLLGDDNRVTLSTIETPWRCDVVAKGRTTRTSNIIPSVNPAEMGVELIQLLRFRIDDDDVLLDGEILENGPYLARRPVALFRLEALRAIFECSGELTLREASRDRRKLPIMGGADFKIFDTDVQSRKQRLNVDGLAEGERKLMEEWLDAYEAPLSSAMLSGETVRLLCPVTWKTLEAAFVKGVL